MKKFISNVFMWCGWQMPLLAQAEDLPPVRDQGMWQTLIMLAMFLVFFYLIMFRPEQKRRKAMSDLRSALKKGDRVTAMGILGTVVRVQETSVILKMYDGTKIEMLKDAISEILPQSEGDKKEGDKKEELNP